jgi:hypothetical protein
MRLNSTKSFLETYATKSTVYDIKRNCIIQYNGLLQGLYCGRPQGLQKERMFTKLSNEGRKLEEEEEEGGEEEEEQEEEDEEEEEEDEDEEEKEEEEEKRRRRRKKKKRKKEKKKEKERSQ